MTLADNTLSRDIAIWAAIVVALLAGWLFIRNDFYLRLMMVGAAYMVAAIPFGLLMGHMGYLAMGQAAFNKARTWEGYGRP